MKIQELDEKLGGTLAESGKTAFTTKESELIHLAKKGRNELIFTQNDESLLFAELAIAFSKASSMLEGSPRVLWFCASEKRIQETKQAFATMYRRTDITLEFANDKGKIIEQRNAIFEGSEWLLGNPKRLLELYNQNGFHVNQIKLVIVDELELICKEPQALQGIRRIAESLPKCQYLFFAAGKHRKIDELCEEVCNFYEIQYLD